MTYKFVFKANDAKFACNLMCATCVAQTSNGNQCKNRTCIGVDYCWVHLLSMRQLRIKPSSIEGAGSGLFAMNNNKKDEILFRKNDIVIEYNGELINEEVLNTRYKTHTAPYGIQITKDQIEDGACKRGIGSIANHSYSPNVKYAIRGKRIVLIAIKNIKHNNEILANYGNTYWNVKDNTKHTTY